MPMIYNSSSSRPCFLYLKNHVRGFGNNDLSSYRGYYSILSKSLSGCAGYFTHPQENKAFSEFGVKLYKYQEGIRLHLQRTKQDQKA